VSERRGRKYIVVFAVALLVEDLVPLLVDLDGQELHVLLLLFGKKLVTRTYSDSACT